MLEKRMGALALALACAAPADAETRLVAQAPQLYFVPAAAQESVQLHKGDYVMRAPLKWAKAAILDGSVEVKVDERVKRFERGEILPAATLQFDDPRFNGAAAFCTPREAAERKLDAFGGFGGGLLARALVKSSTDAQFCLIDGDGDGRAEHQVLVSAGSAAARTPTAIAPLPYRVAENVPVSRADDEVRLLFRGKALATTSPGFELEIVQQGKKRVFSSISLGHGRATDKFTYVSSKAGWPRSVEIFGATFAVTAYDPKAELVTISWPQSAAPAPIIISDGIRYYGR